MVILDTNIIIDHIRQNTPPNSFFMQLVNDPEQNVAISIITIQELYAGKGTLKAEVERIISNTLSLLKILSYTYEVARYAGEIARDLNRPISFADAAIAATTVINGAQLATLDRKDFSGIKNLVLL